jgi:hypothetical protein
MTTLKTRDVDKALMSKLGFEKVETHHHVYRLWLGGQLAVRIYISHGERELSPYHVDQMAKQMHLRPQEFVDAIACPLSQEDYYQLLQERLPGL